MNETKAYALRLPAGLHVRLVDAAAGAHRSLNSEIVHRLETSLTSGVTLSGVLGEPDVPALVATADLAGAPRGSGSPSKKKARTGMCPHRRPVGTFCPKCDI